MPKIKIDTSGVSEDEAKAFGSGSGESPRPGVYKAKVIEVNPGYAKDGDGGPDKKKPRLEVIYQIQGGEFGGSQLWEYVILPGHESFGDSAKKRMFQLLRAVGLKPTLSELDTDKLVNKAVRVRVRKGTNQEGDYRGEFGAVFKDSDSDIKLTSTAAAKDDSDDELIDDDEAVLDDEGGTEETDWDARKVELAAMSAPDLKAIAKEWKDNGWDLTIGGTKSELVDKIIAVEQEAANLPDDEAVTDDDDVIIDDDDDVIIDDDDKSEYLTEEQLKAMDPKDLLKLAKDDFDIDAKAAGLKTKNTLIAAILEAQGATSGDDEDMPF